jgi:trans-2,3-dihydro-3-hydroxyanthranilate isomerase
VSTLSAVRYSHVDVFSAEPYSGNSLAVFMDVPRVTVEQMLRITQELRHFETVFMESTVSPSTKRARVFDLFEELPFAGHPLLGAAAVLHRHTAELGARSWEIELAAKTVTVETERSANGYYAVLDQGAPRVSAPLSRDDIPSKAFTLSRSDLHRTLPPQVISTGLAYLIVPVASGALARAQIRGDITPLLRAVGAQFAVFFDETALEIRHWNNDGRLEDVATGSAAGTIGAYRLSHGLVRGGDSFVLQQGRYVGRPSLLCVQPEGSPESISTVRVGGDVAFVGTGTLEVLP